MSEPTAEDELRRLIWEVAVTSSSQQRLSAELRSRIDHQVDAIRKEAVRELRDALEAVEWVRSESGPGALDLVCPWCDSWHPTHKPTCLRQAALRRNQE